MKLSLLKPKQTAIIRSIALSQKDCQRLFYLGIYPGAKITLLRKAWMQDPQLYFVCGNALMLRNVDANHIEVEVI